LRYKIDPHGLHFAEQVNNNYVEPLSKTQLLVILDAYEAGKQIAEDNGVSK
jgi:hypothetical protein